MLINVDTNYFDNSVVSSTAYIWVLRYKVYIYWSDSYENIMYNICNVEYGDSYADNECHNEANDQTIEEWTSDLSWGAVVSSGQQSVIVGCAVRSGVDSDCTCCWSICHNWDSRTYSGSDSSASSGVRPSCTCGQSFCRIEANRMRTAVPYGCSGVRPNEAFVGTVCHSSRTDRHMAYRYHNSSTDWTTDERSTCAYVCHHWSEGSMWTRPTLRRQQCPHSLSDWVNCRFVSDSQNSTIGSSDACIVRIHLSLLSL